MKPSKSGVNIARELAKVDLNKFTCDNHCYNCIYWTTYCTANMVKSIIEKSNRYLENHKE